MIVRDAKLRSLIEKGPSFRDQNCINWSINESLCKEASKYKRKMVTVDLRALITLYTDACGTPAYSTRISSNST